MRKAGIFEFTHANNATVLPSTVYTYTLLYVLHIHIYIYVCNYDLSNESINAFELLRASNRYIRMTSLINEFSHTSGEWRVKWWLTIQKNIN